MRDANLELVQQLVAEEIRRVVGEAIQSESCLSIGQHAASIHRAYPNCGMTADEIGAELLDAAVSARIPVEISRPQSPEPIS